MGSRCGKRCAERGCQRPDIHPPDILGNKLCPPCAQAVSDGAYMHQLCERCSHLRDMPPGPQPNSPVGERAESEVGGGSPAGAVSVNACQVDLRTKEDEEAFADIVAAGIRHMRGLGKCDLDRVPHLSYELCEDWRPIQAASEGEPPKAPQKALEIPPLPPPSDSKG